MFAGLSMMCIKSTTISLYAATKAIEVSSRTMYRAIACVTYMYMCVYVCVYVVAYAKALCTIKLVVIVTTAPHKHCNVTEL